MVVIASPTRDALQANDRIQTSVCNASLLVEAAQTGAVEIWGMVLKELRGRGLLQEEVRHDGTNS